MPYGDPEIERLHGIWKNMKKRCLNPRHWAYARYGGRGIKVCERWANSFRCFVADMSPSPKGMTLDRIDNDGDYEPMNCQWASRLTQAQRRARSLIPVGTEKLDHIAARLGLSRTAISHRIRNGWSIEHATTIRKGEPRHDR